MGAVSATFYNVVFHTGGIQCDVITAWRDFFYITGIVLEMKERWKKGTQVWKEKQEKGRAGIYPFGV